MRLAYDAEQVRAAEAPLLESLPAGTLMARASAALARRCASLLPRVYGARVVLLVGRGNNGGDALHAGAILARRGADVVAVCAGEPHPAGAGALRAAYGRLIAADEDAAGGVVADADLVVDGLVGLGGRGGLRGVEARLAELAAQSGAVVLAVDVPSGVDASTGEVAGPAVRADVTVCFGALKVGLVVDPGADYAGLVEVVDIGLSLPAADVTLLDPPDVAARLPHPARETDKYRRGVVGVAAGSETYPGAAVLAVGGALAAGPGMVRYVGPARPADFVRRRWPEALVTTAAPGDGRAVDDAGRVQAWVVGSGLGTDDAAAAVVRRVLATDLPVIADADAVNLLGRNPQWLRRRTAPTLLTPHAGELARFLDAERDDVEARRLHYARLAASESGATVLLKGSTTVIADPAGAVRVNTTSTAYLATAGSGDVLAGVCGTLLAGGLDALDAGSVAAFLHGLAGLRGGAPIHAFDIVDRLPEAVRAVHD
jgi:hydroxyethylthiazole kinase-like uncharacterized protein yjeF